MSPCNHFQLFVELSETLFISISVFLAKPVGGKMCHPLHSLQPWFQLHSNLVFRFVFCSFSFILYFCLSSILFPLLITQFLKPCIRLLFYFLSLMSGIFNTKISLFYFFLYKVEYKKGMIMIISSRWQRPQKLS